MMIRALMLAAAVTMASVDIVAQTLPTFIEQTAQPAQPAQTPVPAQPRGSQAPTVAPPAPAAARREGQPINIKVEVSITDQSGGMQALKKTVTVVTGDNMTGFIRTSAAYDPPIGVVPLNVDVEPQVLTDNRIKLHLNLQYNLPSALVPVKLSEGRAAAAAGQAPRDGGAALRQTEIRENLSLILENSKPLVAAQSADPVGDRQVTIEVKATVIR
jgi:hypothetical protein